MNAKNKRLGDLLVESGLITEEQLMHALQLQKKLNKKLGEVLIEEKILEEKQIIEVLEFQLGIPHVVLDKYYIQPDIPKLISERLAKRHLLIPIRLDRGKLIVAMSDPLNIFAMDDIKLITGYDVEPVIATRKDVLMAIDQYYQKASAEKALEEFKESYDEVVEEIDEESLAQIKNAPVVKLVNSIISQAVKMRASDIHIEPYEKILRVRFRVDGELQENMTPSKSSHSAIVTRIKIMGKMDIAEKRIPQDGRVEMNVEGRDIDMRISILPTVYGEKIVIRLLDRSGVVISKSELGFTPQNLRVFDQIIKNPHGIILVTGPTGSGKTTTLYAALTELNDVHKNIITVEDPVEYRLEGINQSQVNIKAGLTFASGLRSILRQDPDIIMIGEIRDGETAQIAVRAAITGHLVLSTLHTNDTASTVARLVDMGIEPYLISSSVVGIVAQRLVKRICKNCKIAYHPSVGEINLLQLPHGAMLYKGEGCNACNQTGYRGRTAIHEVMPVTKDIKKLIDERKNTEDLRKAAVEQGMTTLRQSCRELVINGITTIEELLRMTYNLD
ncbi:type II secretion system ATPase GspE [Geosporobacter ferrireducens]|uniref:protein-secreting ATPase n=1 Tax=Geosporobacter ferrireducens TaxID=1424294 RepID=A0A1D8GB97_9FIRM|nr:type II secretion system ATPase GspE [Geosporobacter ferrireducens]AOT68185.1 type II secretion system protein GspE [Geosporobacter ferrireducens]MTI54235.1 type II secretion system protein GspE [Geosporobacter ferrireducens]